MEQLFEFMVNHWVLWLAFFAILALVVVTEMGGFGQLAAVTPAQAIPLMNHKSAVVLDVRDAEAFATGHIIGATRFSLADAETKVKTIQKYKQKPIIIVDANQRDSAKMAALLRKQGFTDIVTLRGGIQAWREAQFPLVTENKDKGKEKLKVIEKTKEKEENN